ncbi:hypothetical protein AB0B52_35430 [Streptomyces griseofuscus]|uniref:hypothetical protein n=1 Tax=Streptomyces griseofuscus TaxID=146922 RepID=UPI003401EC33
MLPGGGDHGDAPGRGELDGEDADAAARAVDQQGLARPGAGWCSARQAVSPTVTSAAAVSKEISAGLGIGRSGRVYSL